jgi:dimethylaniline monooxygenase (N-oxide forming)
MVGGGGYKACIVGGGAAGIATAKTLLERGLEFDCFESAPHLGGLWAEGEGDCVVRYSSLHLNSSKRQMQFRDYPFPDAYPDFPSRSQVAAYLGGYARHFGVEDRVEVGRTVTDVCQTAAGRWAVRIDDREERTYDAVLVASGHHSTPKLPPDAGRGFQGEVLHSHDVRDATPFEGRRVLVVGFGNSAADIASLVSTTAAQTYLSTRRGAHVVPKYLFGRPFDELPAPPWPRRLRWAWYALATRLTVGRLDRYGLPAPGHRFGSAAVTISSDLLMRIVHGDIQPRPAVAQLHGDGVTFANGHTDPIDTIIYCTGYAHSASFLERNGLNPGRGGYRLFEQIWDPRFRGLAHVGLVQPLGSFFPVFEAQAKILADWIGGTYTLPRSDAMLEQAQRAQRRRERRYTASERHVLQIDELDYRKRLQRERRRGARRRPAGVDAVTPTAPPSPPRPTEVQHDNGRVRGDAVNVTAATEQRLSRSGPPRR